jgi:RNA polymerase sigma-70 factor (ECF subfamily)
MDSNDSLVTQHGPAVWRTITRLLGSVRADDGGAADCFQDTFVQYIQLIRRRPADAPAALLIHIASRRAIDHIRRRAMNRQKNRALDLDDRSSREPSPVDSAAERELSDLLRNALGELPEDRAAVFCLTQLEGLDHAEVARVLGITANHVGVLLHRARAELQRRLASYIRPQPR